LLEVVDDAAGRADQHIDAVLQRLALFFVVDAPKYHGNPESRVFTQHLRVIEDLHGELARGRQDQRTDAAAAAAMSRWIGQQALIQGHQKRGGLAGARLSLSCNIFAQERNRQGTRLHGCGADETSFTDAAGDFGKEIERIESEVGKVCLCH
jgi:hypothetical protein